MDNSKYSNEELILLIDALQEWYNTNPPNKEYLQSIRKELILELEFRYIDSDILKLLKSK